MKFQTLRPATLLNSDSSKDVFLWIFGSFKDIYFVEYLCKGASELTAVISAEEIVECVRKYKDEISENLQSLSSY